MALETLNWLAAHIRGIVGMVPIVLLAVLMPVVAYMSWKDGVIAWRRRWQEPLIIRRDDDPAAFRRYLWGLVIGCVFSWSFLALCIASMM
jgi:hypothetical protein